LKTTWAVLLMLLVCVAPAAGQDPADPDQEGCKDSALLTRMPGCQLYDCSTKEYDEAALVVGPVNAETGEAVTKMLEGAIAFNHYVCPAKYSHVQIVRNMETALKKAGFSIVTSTTLDDSSRVLTVRKGPQWLELKLEHFNEYPTYKQTAVLETAMAQQMVADAAGIEAAISESGSVALYGITFDTGKATLQPASEKVLAEIVKVLKERTDWRFEVQGHTDNVGTAAANRALSQQRAAAVVDWLTQQGIPADRLVAKGYGDTAPVADNGTEDGRAKNRRVELKKLNIE
jgi:OOP family OmpA-OmpF porin